MGVIQQGLNDAITGATFLINTSPGVKEMFESRNSINTTKALKREADNALAASLRSTRIATVHFNSGVKEGSMKGKNLAYDVTNARNELDRASEFGKSHENSIREGLVKYPKAYSNYAAHNTTIELAKQYAMAKKAYDNLYSNIERYGMQKKNQTEFKEILKNRAKSDYDELVKIGINPKVAEAGIKQAAKRGEYNGETNTKR